MDSLWLKNVKVGTEIVCPKCERVKMFACQKRGVYVKGIGFTW